VDDVDPRIEKVYSFCSLLKRNCVKEELNSYLKGYQLKDINRMNNKVFCIFLDTLGNKAELIIHSNSVCLLKHKDDIAERFIVDDKMLFVHQILEKRNKGVMFFELRKNYKEINNDKFMLVDLYENRYIFYKSTIDKRLLNVSFDNTKSLVLLFKILELSLRGNLKKYSDFNNSFSIHRNCYNSNFNYSVFLNGENISKLYSFVNGEDDLYRIYDLYNGIISPKCEKDILRMNLGNVNIECFDVKNLRGIIFKEDNLIGKSKIKYSTEYELYVKNFFKDKLGYFDKLEFDRDSVVDAIKYQNDINLHEKLNDTSRSINAEESIDINYYGDNEKSINERFRPKRLVKKILSGLNIPVTGN